MLDMHRLWLLRELSIRGTVHAVATALGYSPSAVSQQLTKLQREVGATLLERDGRGVRLTPEAWILVTHTESVLEQLERAETEVAALRRVVTGTLRVATFQSVALAFIPEVLRLLAERHPRLHIEVSIQEPDQAIPGLSSRDFDVVVDEEYPGITQQPDDRLERQELVRDPMVLVVPRSWGRPEDIRELAGRPWAAEPLGSPARNWMVACCRTLGFEPEVRFAFDDLTMQLRFVETGHAVSLVPSLAVGINLGPFGRQAHVLPIPGEPARQISTLVRASGAQHPAVVAFRGALHEAADAARSALDVTGQQHEALPAVSQPPAQVEAQILGPRPMLQEN